MIKLPGCPNNYLIPLNCSSIFHEKRLIIANIEYVCVCDPKFEQGLSLVACHFWVINVSVYFLFFVTRNRFPWMLSRVKHIRSPFKQTYLARAGCSLLTCLVFCSPDIVVILFSVFLSHSLFLCASVCVFVWLTMLIAFDRINWTIINIPLFAYVSLGWFLSAPAYYLSRKWLKFLSLFCTCAHNNGHYLLGLYALIRLWCVRAAGEMGFWKERSIDKWMTNVESRT